MVREPNATVEKPVSRNLPNKKGLAKVPKKIHKAEREKLKRDHLNELFLELGQALEPTRQNNGKASMLTDTARLLRDLLTRVENLKKENAVLLSETRYVTVERNDLEDENKVLEAEIDKLRNDLRERMQSAPVWTDNTEEAPNQPPSVDGSVSSLSKDQETESILRPPSVVRPVFVIPLPQNLQTYPAQDTLHEPCKQSSQVKRPHARYPSPSDAWPSQLLNRQRPEAANDGE